MLTGVTLAIKTVIALAKVRAWNSLLEAFAVFLLAIRSTAVAALKMPLVLRRCPVMCGI